MRQHEMIEVTLCPILLFNDGHAGALYRFQRPQIEPLPTKELHDWVARIGPGVADVLPDGGSFRAGLDCSVWPRSTRLNPMFECDDILAGKFFLRRHFEQFVR